MNPKHTSGPWKPISGWGSYTTIMPVNSKGNPRNGNATEDIADIDLDHPQGAANARLIAAAPDLLYACSLAAVVFGAEMTTDGAGSELTPEQAAKFEAVLHLVWAVRKALGG